MVQVHDDVQVHLLQDLHLIDQGALPELHVDLDLALDLDDNATERAIRLDHACGRAERASRSTTTSRSTCYRICTR
jgi:hypothetical protein